MTETRPLPCQLDELLEAVTARDVAVLDSYLDLRTGRVFPLLDPSVTGADNEAIESAMDQEPTRYARIPLYDREYRLMCAFADEVEDDVLSNALDLALRGKGAFRGFLELLDAHPLLRSQWEGYRRAALIRWVRAWLRTHGVHAEGPEAQIGSGADDGEVLGLHHLLLLGGGPQGPDGTVRRTVVLPTASQARKVFKRFARQLCDYRGEPWRGHYVRDAALFERDGVRLVHDADRIELTLVIEPAIGALFSRGR